MMEKTDPGVRQPGFQRNVITVPQSSLIEPGIAMPFSVIQCDDELGTGRIPENF